MPRSMIRGSVARLARRWGPPSPRALLEAPTIREAAKLAGLPEDSLYRWTARDEAFKAAWRDGVRQASHAARSRLRVLTSAAANHLTADLRRLAPDLRRAGLAVEVTRSKRGSRITIEPLPAGDDGVTMGDDALNVIVTPSTASQSHRDDGDDGDDQIPTLSGNRTARKVEVVQTKDGTWEVRHPGAAPEQFWNEAFAHARARVLNAEKGDA